MTDSDSDNAAVAVVPTPNDNETTPLIAARIHGYDDDGDDGDADVFEGDGCVSFACDPRREYHKYFVLIIMCFLSFGSYFCYDNPAALELQMERDMNVTTGSFMRLYSWYSWPNVVICWFGGALIDRVLGIRLGTIIFAAFVTFGQIVFAFGAYLNRFWLMELGRFIFGLGGESLCVAQNTYAVGWFRGSALNTVFGLQLSFSRVGSTVNMNVMQPLYDSLRRRFVSLEGHSVLGVALFIAGIFCVFSLLCSLLMAYFDKRAARICHKEKSTASEPMKLRDMISFRPSIWILCIICVSYYVTIFPFIGLGQVFFEKKFHMSRASASMVDSLVYIISAFASPVFGLLIDRTGRNVFWLLFGVIITLGCHATLCLTQLNPYVPMGIMGLAYSLVASALWPMVAYLVPTNQLATAYGLMQSVQNLGLAVVSILAGIIVDKYGYIFLEWFFICWLVGSVLSCILLLFVDKIRDDGILNRSAKERCHPLVEALNEEDNTINA